MSANRDRIRSYYADAQEVTRLDAGSSWFERDRTLSIIAAYVPTSARVLDAGGGPGVYTAPMLKQGYRVTMVDLSPELVEVARGRLAEEALEAEAVVCADLMTWAPTRANFDAVLCLGPGYHVDGEEELRVLTARCVSLTRPGGVVLFAFVPRLTGVAGLVARMASAPHQLLPGTLTRVMETGRFENDADEGFREGFFARPEQVSAAFEALGVERLTLRSIRGFSAHHGDALRVLRDHHPERFAEVVALTEATATRPEVVATCWHAMYVGRVPG